MDKYKTIEVIEKRKYGTVYRATNQCTGEIVTLKKIQLTKSEKACGLLTQEVCILKELKHKNIVKFHEVIYKETIGALVFESFELDLKDYFKLHGNSIKSETTRSFMLQMMKGVSFCHSKDIVHRDLKPKNLLINKSGILKITDFGLATFQDTPHYQFKYNSFSLWYTPPDILFGATNYLTSYDIWSVGCIFAELSNFGFILFPGDNEANQMEQIFSVLGTPTNHSWPGVQNLPKFKSYPVYPSNPNWKSLLPNLSDKGHDLISELIVCNPAKRISADVALKHPYFF